MTYRLLYTFLLFIIITFLISSCSSPKKDYEPVQQLLAATEQNISGTSDAAANIKSCQSVIDVLQNFIKAHPEGEWNITAKTALNVWQIKRDSLQEVVNRTLDFEKIQKLQGAAEDVMQHSFDYAVQMKSCDDMIGILQEYLLNHTKSDWSTSVQTSLMSWKSRKTNLVQQLGSLFNKLSKLMEERAIQEAEKVHQMSNVEKIQLERSDTASVGGNINITKVYAVRMVGSIAGKHIFKLDITVSGSINPETKQTFVNDHVKVVE